MPVIVSGGNSTRTVVVQRQTGTAVVQARSSAVAVANRNTVESVEDRPSIVGVVSRGPQGAQGPAGSSGAGLLPPINFSYGDASPAVVLLLSVTSEIAAVSLQIEEAFNGVGASIALGTAGEPGALIPSADNDPSMLVTYEFSPRIEYAGGTLILLTINAGTGGSSGRGQIIVTSVPSN